MHQRPSFGSTAQYCYDYQHPYRPYPYHPNFPPNPNQRPVRPPSQISIPRSSADRVMVTDEDRFDERDYYVNSCGCNVHIRRLALTAAYVHGLLCFAAFVVIVVTQFEALGSRQREEEKGMKEFHRWIANCATLVMSVTLLTIGCLSHVLETEKQLWCAIPHMTICLLGMLLSIIQMVAALWLIVWDTKAGLWPVVSYIVLAAIGAVGVPLHALYLFASYRAGIYLRAKKHQVLLPTMLRRDVIVQPPPPPSTAGGTSLQREKRPVYDFYGRM